MSIPGERARLSERNGCKVFNALDMDEPPEIELLRLWFNWWSVTDDVPAKLPGALHVRTAVFLQTGIAGEDES